MYNVRAALPVRIWDYFIYSSAEQANKLTGICNYFIYFTLSIYMDVRAALHSVRRAGRTTFQDSGLFYLFICGAGK
jgi:hypothetical protein